MFSFDSGTAMMPGPIVLIAKATLLLIVALGASALLQRASAGARHLVWVGILGAIVMLPALSAWSPVRLPILPSQITPATPLPAEPLAALSPVFERERIPSVAAPAPASANAAVDIVEAAPRFTAWQVALFTWSTVAAGVVLWLAFGFFSVRRIVRRGRVLNSRDWTTPLYEIADRLGIDTAPRLLRSDDVRMPFACGLLKPTIVLPAESDEWTAERRSAVLMHELAHIRRRDLVGHTVGRVACAIYWFHPLVWTAARRLRIESERACDDLALTSGLRATNYAEHLLDIVSSIRQPHTPAAAIPMAHRREFEGRMLAILDPDLRRRSGRVQSLSLLGAVAALVVVVGGAVPATRAQVLDNRQASVSADSLSVDRDTAATEAVDRLATAAQKGDVSDAARGSDNSPRPSGPDRGEDQPSEIVNRAHDRNTGELQALVLQGKPGEDRATLLMQVLRSDTSASLRRVAAWGLSNFADRADVGTALAAALRRDADAEVREMSAWSAASGEDSEEVMGALSEALRRDAHHEVREMAAWALGNLGGDNGVDALTAALGDSSATLRSTAMWALGNSGLHTAPRGVIDGLRDPDKRVRRLAAWVLYNIEDANAVGALESALNAETDKDLRTAYIRALGAIGGESADALGRLLDSRDPEVRAVVVNALAGRGSGPWPWPYPRPRPSP